MHTKFSVLMSVYRNDDAKHFREALDSILGNTRVPDEVVLMVDGPVPSAIDDVIREYVSSYNIIRVYRNESNMGLGLTLRRGVLLCSHELIFRMDSDDISRVDRFEKQLRIFSHDPDIDVLGGNIEEFDGLRNTKRIRQGSFNPEQAFRRLILRNPMNHVTVGFKKSSVLSVGNYEDFPYYEDFFLWYKMICNNMKLVNIGDILVDVRLGEFSRRRFGYSYFKHERRFFKELLNRKAINRYVYCFNVWARFAVRMSPSFLHQMIYSKLLRLSWRSS